MAKEGEKAPSSANISTFKKFLESKSGNVKSKLPHQNGTDNQEKLAKSDSSKPTPLSKKKVASTGIDIADLVKQSSKDEGKKKVDSGGIDILQLAKQSKVEGVKKKVSSGGLDIADLAKQSKVEGGKKKVSSGGLDIADLAKQSKVEGVKKKVSSGGLNIAELAKNSMNSPKKELGVGSGKLILEKNPLKNNTTGSLKSGFGGTEIQTKSNLKSGFGGVKLETKGELKSSFGGGLKSKEKTKVESVGDIGELLESRKSLMKNTLNHNVNELHEHLKEKITNSSKVVVDLAELSKIEKESRESWYKTTHEMTVEKKASKESIQRRYNRALKAREQAEAVIEKSTRKLYLAQEETKKALESETKAKAEVEAILLDLNKAIAEANNSELRRRALMITGITGIVLYLFTEFSLEPFVEAAVGSGIELILAKVFLLFILIPFQMVTEKFMIKQTHSDGDGIREHMFREILSVVIDDGVINEKERNLIETFRRHNGLDHTRADEIMSEYLTS